MLKYNYNPGLNHYRLSRRLSEGSGRSYSSSESNDSHYTVTSANILALVPSPAPFFPHGHFLSYTVTDTSRRKSLAMVLDEDSEGSD